MKFHEAIDMIWDGKKSRGEASRKSSPDSRFTIRWDEAVHENVLCNSRGSFGENTFILDVDDLIETDWVVEKDGAVYEEYKYQCNCPWPNYADEIKCTSVCLKCNYPREIFPIELEERQLRLKALDWLNNQDERTEIEDKHAHLVKKAMERTGVREAYSEILKEEDKMPLDEKYKIDAKDVFEAALHEAVLRIKRPEQDERAELEEETEPSDDERDHIISLLSKRYGELEEFRRSILDEDWLEKKMLCFMQRCEMPVMVPLRVIDLDSECANEDCPFCFPPAKPETDHTPDGRKTAQQESLVQRTIREMQPEPTAKDASKKAVDEIMGMVNDHLEKLREKVTVDQIISVVGEIKNKWYWYGKRPSEYPLDDGPLWKELEQKLEYLVSLQEKVK